MMLQFYLQLIETEEDRQLFILLYEGYRKQMCTAAAEVLEDHSLSEDAVHNAFVGVISVIHRFRGKQAEDIRNYVLKAARNAAITLSGKEKRWRELLNAPKAEPVEDAVLEALCARADRETIINAILEMREPYSMVLYSALVMEMTSKEIAAALQRKEPTVRKQLCRGRNMLKTILEEAQLVNV